MKAPVLRRAQRRAVRRAAARVVQEIGRVGRARGRENEERLLAAVLSIVGQTEWIRGARMGSPEEDRRGIDLVVDTNVGPLFLQAKSSRDAASRFRASRGHTLIGVVVVSLDAVTTGRRAITELSKLRAAVIANREGAA